MKLLVVMANYPFPPRTGSAVVAYNSMKYLSKRHYVEFVSLQSREGKTEPPEFLERVRLLSQRSHSKLVKLIRYLFYMLVGVPPSISASASRAMRKIVKSRFESGQFDAILLFEMSAIQYCPPSSYRKLIVNIEDPESIKLSRMAELPIWSLWQRIKISMLIKSSAQYEGRILRKMAKVLLLSESDVHDAREQFPYVNYAYVPYGIEQRSSIDVASYDDRERAIVFSGNMYHPPNVDGALFLLNHVFPMILQEYPTANLWIVGADPGSRIYQAAQRFGERVTITGRVGKVAPYIQQATVSICPVRLKIGVQTKILEAMSWGTPVVTTSAGNSGINGVSGTHLWVEDTPHALSKRVCDLLKGHDWSRLSAGGRRFAIERFSWEGSVAQLERHLVSLSCS